MGVAVPGSKGSIGEPCETNNVGWRDMAGKASMGHDDCARETCRLQEAPPRNASAAATNMHGYA